jgi:hypothetical protein
MHTFALHGKLQEGATCYKFMLILSNKLLVQSYDKYGGKNSVNENLISIIWTLMYREIIVRQEKNNRDLNPLIPRLLEKLYSFKREEPLTKVENLELFQIKIWLDHMVSEGRLPDAFAKCIPETVLDMADTKFYEYDKQ